MRAKHYRSMQVLLRRTPPDIKASAKLKIHQVDFARLPATFPTMDDVFIALGTTRLLAPLGWIMPKSVRPIPARAVASALLAAVLDAKPGVQVLKSGAMQARDQP
jgi:hypothetical protein